ncbi:hypothetical protein I317_06085 [Kwoniella heveanensis CBS 569]|nr:hypothetical protein I317_06085 [Kwoniella heveanensis CBS 569]
MSSSLFGSAFDSPLSSPPASPRPATRLRFDDARPSRSRWETRASSSSITTSAAHGSRSRSDTTQTSPARQTSVRATNTVAGPPRINLTIPSSTLGLPSLGSEGGLPSASARGEPALALASGSGSGSVQTRQGTGSPGPGGHAEGSGSSTSGVGPARRRRVEEALNIEQGDTRGMSQILDDRRAQGNPNSHDLPRSRIRLTRVAPHSLRPPPPSSNGSTRDARLGAAVPGDASHAEGSGGRRRGTVVEVADDSDDDDIVFTGENRVARPSSQPEAPVLRRREQIRPAQPVEEVGDGAGAGPEEGRRATRAGAGAGTGQGGGRLHHDGDFRRAMHEIDAIIDARRQAVNAIVAEQEDERRRQVLSPPIQPSNPPRQRIGLGGGGLYRRGEPALRHGPGAPGGRMMMVNIEDVDDPRIRQVMNHSGARTVARRAFPPAGPPMRGGGEARDDMELGFGALGGLGALLLGQGRYGMNFDMGMGMGIGVAGPAGRPEDVQTILSRVEVPKYDPPPQGFTRDFETVSDHDHDKQPITIDDEGNVVKPSPKTTKLQMDDNRKRKPYLVCTNCPSALLVSSAYKSETNADRVWALRCGHLVDQKCLEDLSTPISPTDQASVFRYPNPDLEVLDEVPALRRNKRRKTTSKSAGGKRQKEKRPDEYVWRCPVFGCEEEHVSVDIGGSWVSKEGEGAIAVYA